MLILRPPEQPVGCCEVIIEDERNLGTQPSYKRKYW